MKTGKLLGSGRRADVYALDEAWVLRRYRNGYGDAAAEARVMEHVRVHGYPVPGIRAATRGDLVMERLTGPTMLEAVTDGLLGPAEAGATLAGLLRDLHALPVLGTGSAPAARILHLDLHPLNVIMTPTGPRVIDWDNAEEGAPGLDWGTTAVILAQAAVSGEPRVDGVRTLLTALLEGQEGASELTEDGLEEAVRRRSANPTMTAREVGLLGETEDLIRGLWAV